MKCGDQYSPQHRFPKQIPIHVLEEVLDLYSLGTSSEEHSDCSSQGSEAEILPLSYCATVGIQGKKTMRLKSTIQQQEVLVLIDSGSSGIFINNTVVQQLGLPVTAAPLTHVTVADGGKLTSEGVVENLQWWTQGHCFTTTAKILQLGYYDMILGMDWLEQFSPMWVHWKRKRMRFNYQGARITLTGVKDCTSTCLPLQTKKLKWAYPKRRCCTTHSVVQFGRGH
jgi:hypothetical protein